MIIGIDLNFYFADGRGMGRYVRNILKHMLAERSHRYRLFMRNPEEQAQMRQQIAEQDRLKGIEVMLMRDIPQTEVDCLWYPWNRIDRLPKSGKTILTIHDLAPFLFPYRDWLRFFDQKKDETRFRKAALQARRIIAVSQQTKYDIMKLLKVPESKIKVIYSGVEETFSPLTVEPNRKKALCQNWGVGEDFLLYVGADDERKNLFNLLKAFNLMTHTPGFAFSLILAGTGHPLPLQYRDFLNGNQLSSRVIWLESVNAQDLPDLYRSARMLVFPSLYEGFGLPLLEAMASGLPVAASKISVIPEVAGDGALYFDPREPRDIAAKVLQLLNDESIARQLAEKGLERAGAFKWEKTVRAMLAEFAAL